MAVPSSGEVSLSRIYKEIHFCEYVGTNNVGGYWSNSSVSGPISLSGLDSDSSLRSGETNKGDGSAPYGMSEWYEYSDFIPNAVYFTAEFSEGVPENPTYTAKFITAQGTKTAYLYPPSTNIPLSNILLGTGNTVTVRVDRISPDSTVQDGAEITWFSRVDPCDSGTQTQDQALTFTNGQSIVNESYSYTNIEQAAYFRVVIIEG